MNQPPKILRTAVSGLRAQYESDGHQIEDAVNRILERKPRLRRNYGRPDLSSDRLYKSEIVHPSGSESPCDIVCGDDPSRFIQRDARTEEDDNPTIHYGLIASANQLMKDALIRDKLAAEKNVLCFEMEAAGVVNDLPCLVIRGICAYADSHKNKDWHGYAAMVAAAYAKDLLCQIPHQRVERETRTTEVLAKAAGTTAHVAQTTDHIDRRMDFSKLTIAMGPSSTHMTIKRKTNVFQALGPNSLARLLNGRYRHKENVYSGYAVWRVRENRPSPERWRGRSHKTSYSERASSLRGVNGIEGARRGSSRRLQNKSWTAFGFLN